MAKPQTGLPDEELNLDPELENLPDPPEDDPVDDADEDAEEAVEEVDTAPVAQEPEEERIPKSRFDAEKARADTLQQVLEQLRTVQPQQPQQQHVTQPQPVQEDAEANLTPEDRQWRKYIREVVRPEIERRAREIATEIKQQSIDPLQRVSIEVQERIAENDARRQFKDWDLVRDQVNKTRAEWFQRYGVVAPPDVAYHYVKGQHAVKQAQSTRTANVRANAKQAATVPNKPPAKKAAPKGPVTLNDVANMSLEDAERWLLKNGTKF